MVGSLIDVVADDCDVHFICINSREDSCPGTLVVHSGEGFGPDECFNHSKALFEMTGSSDAALEAVAQAVQQQPKAETGSDGTRMLETFLRNHPLTFKGRYDPDGAQKWLKEIERIFKVMQCSETQKVRFGTHMFAEEADDWWVSLLPVLEQDDAVGDMSVTEYAAKFVELAKFYPHYSVETAEFSRCIKFENGLRADIKRAIGYQQIRVFSELMKASQSRQKSYHDKRRKALEFQEGDHVFLRVTPLTGVGRALKSRKLTPKFIGPYQISERVGIVAYSVGLPPHLSNLHDVFHVSQLRKYVADPSHVIPRDDVQVRDNLTVETMPLRIDDRKVKSLRGKEIPLVRVVWGGATGESFTWELEKFHRSPREQLVLASRVSNFMARLASRPTRHGEQASSKLDFQIVVIRSPIFHSPRVRLELAMASNQFCELAIAGRCAREASYPVLCAVLLA
ncbi:chromo domain protein [Medicago truncatula]|uniref:Chromo domain protein n=1 Tax=Medicago truncatula TaxID=3880 RepID=A0A072TH32_MEDTR|nr:chromo domain protein [Medicago truncatula]